MNDLVALQNKYATVPAEIAQQLFGNFNDQSFGQSFSRLSIAGFQFTIKGASSEVIDAQKMFVIFLGEGSADHFIWYSKPFAPGNEDVKPDAVWMRDTPAPSNVPKAVLETQDGQRKAYLIRRRTVFAFVDPNGVRLQPIVFDVGSMSMYGDDKTESGALSYSSYRRWCAKFGVLPCQIMTQIVFDRTQTVPVCKFIPICGEDGRPRLLDNGTQKMIFDLAVSQEVKDLCKVNLVGGEATQGVSVSPQPVVAPAPAPQPEPIPVKVVDTVPQVPSQPKPELNGNVMMTPKVTAVENPVPVQPIPTAPAPTAQAAVNEAQQLLDSNAALDALLKNAGV